MAAVQDAPMPKRLREWLVADRSAAPTDNVVEGSVVPMPGSATLYFKDVSYRGEVYRLWSANGTDWWEELNVEPVTTSEQA